MHNPESVLENETHNSAGILRYKRSPNFGQTTRSCNNQQKKKKKKENLQNCGLCCSGWSQSKIERKRKEGKVSRLWRKLWNMTVIPIVIGALGLVTKGLVKGLEGIEIRGQMETIQTTALLRSPRILRRVLETWGDLLSLNFQWETIG